MGTYIVEIQAVVLRGDGPVGYGVDDLGRTFSVPLDLSLATSVAEALDMGQRPIVAVEAGHAVPKPAMRDFSMVQFPIPRP